MGLFSFLKGKNRVDKPMAPPSGSDLPLLSDLPPIDGSALPSQETSLPDMSSMDSRAIIGKDSLTLQLPPLDFSMPPKDEDSGLPVQKPQINPLPSFPSPADAQQQPSTLQSLEIPKRDTYLDLSEDLNSLFLADNDWHEPDLDNYNPYPEPEIEPPKPSDFGYEEVSEEQPSGMPSESDLPLFDSEDKPRTISNVPVDVFVRGKDYIRVYSELGKINYLLDNQEPRILTLFEDVLSKEEELLKQSKNNMEYIYKRLIIIDKRIFG